jgi:ABC-type multidrug transport system fused ATPase/permease subunit
LNAKILYGYTRWLREKLYAALTRAQWLAFTRTGSAQVNRALMSDLSHVWNGTYYALDLVGATVLMAVYTATALAVSPAITAITVSTAVGLLLVLRRFNVLAYLSGKALQDTSDKFHSSLIKHLNSLKVAKSYGCETWHAQKFSSLSREIDEQRVQFVRVSTTSRTIFQVGTALSLCSFLYVAIVLIHVPTTHVLVMVYLFSRLLPRVSSLHYGWMAIVNMLPSYGAIQKMRQRFETFAEPPIPPGVLPVKLEICLKLAGVCFRYGSRKGDVAIRDVNLAIQAGKTTAIN